MVAGDRAAPETRAALVESCAGLELVESMRSEDRAASFPVGSEPPARRPVFPSSGVVGHRFH